MKKVLTCGDVVLSHDDASLFNNKRTEAVVSCQNVAQADDSCSAHDDCSSACVHQSRHEGELIDARLHSPNNPSLQYHITG